MLGVVIGTYSDYYCSIVGIFGTLFSVILTAYKAVVSNHLMTGRIALSVSEILLKDSSIAVLQWLFHNFVAGEHYHVMIFVEEG
jgi:hypothetical protein